MPSRPEYVSPSDTGEGQNGSMTHEAPPSTLRAPAYGLLLALTNCHFCHAPTPTAAVWVPSFEEHDDEGLVDQGRALCCATSSAWTRGPLRSLPGTPLGFASPQLERQGKPTWPTIAPPAGPFKGTTSCFRRMVPTGPKTMSNLRLFASSEVWARSPLKPARGRARGWTGSL